MMQLRRAGGHCMPQCPLPPRAGAARLPWGAHAVFRFKSWRAFSIICSVLMRASLLRGRILVRAATGCTPQTAAHMVVGHAATLLRCRAGVASRGGARSGVSSQIGFKLQQHARRDRSHTHVCSLQSIAVSCAGNDMACTALMWC